MEKRIVLLAVALDNSPEVAQFWDVDETYVKQKFLESGFLYNIVFRSKTDNNKLPIVTYTENGIETDRILITLPSTIKISPYNNNRITLDDVALFLEAIKNKSSLLHVISKIDVVTKVKFLSIGHYLGLR